MNSIKKRHLIFFAMLQMKVKKKPKNENDNRLDFSCLIYVLDDNVEFMCKYL